MFSEFYGMAWSPKSLWPPWFTPISGWNPEIFHVEVCVSFRHFHGIRHDSERKNPVEVGKVGGMWVVKPMVGGIHVVTRYMYECVVMNYGWNSCFMMSTIKPMDAGLLVCSVFFCIGTIYLEQFRKWNGEIHTLGFTDYELSWWCRIGC